MYSCGPTVYNFVHLGNLRTYIFSDILRRVLEYNGFKIKQAMNITDIDDKIIKAVKIIHPEEINKWHKEIENFTGKYFNAFLRDISSLNIKRSHFLPKATSHIPSMLSIIKILLKKKYAYIVDDGIYFNIAKFKEYGKLSNLKKRQIKVGARVSADEYQKESASDFVLWKFSKARRISDIMQQNEEYLREDRLANIDEPAWRSPWGFGRPGWHIECSAMSRKYLGQPFDIHTGAIDLLFPHHENEIAQSQAAFSKKLANYFVEGEHLLIEGNKMAKRLGNIFILSDIKKRNIDPLAFRHLCLSCHYQSQMNFTWDSLNAAQISLEKLRIDIVNLTLMNEISGNNYNSQIVVDNLGIIPKKKFNSRLVDLSIKKYAADFLRCINDNLAIPKALANVYALLADGNLPVREKLRWVLEFDRVFGLGLECYYKIGRLKASRVRKIMPLIKKREKMRKEKKWQEADKIRHAIENAGFLLEDAEKGAVVKIVNKFRK